MKPSLVISFLMAILVGMAGGFFARDIFSTGEKRIGTPVLLELEFSEFMSKVGFLEWHIVEDKVYEPFPPFSQNPGIARRIIAQSKLPDLNPDEFVRKFQNNAENWITSNGAILKGVQDANHSSIEMRDEGRLVTSVDLPRRFYAIDTTNGVADFGCVVSSGSVTILISIIEGN